MAVKTLIDRDPVDEYLIGCRDPQECLDFLTSFHYFVQRIEESHVVYLITDFEHILEASIPFLEVERVGLLHIAEALRLSHSAILSGRLELLPSQLRGRLLGLENPVIDALRENIDAWQGGPWLRPLTASLIPPGAQGFILKGHSAEVLTSSFAYDGARLVTAGGDSQIIVWDVERRTPICRVPTNSNVQTVAVAKKAPYVLWSTQAPYPHIAAQIVVWDTDNDREVTRLRGHQTTPVCLSVSVNGRRAASVDQEGLVIVWELPTGRELARHQSAGYRSLALDGRGDYLVLTRSDGLYGNMMQRLKGDSGPENGLSAVDDGSELGHEPAGFAVYQLGNDSFQCIWSLSLDDDTVAIPWAGDSLKIARTLDFDPSGQRLAFLGNRVLGIYHVGVADAVREIEVESSLRPCLTVDWDSGRFCITDAMGTSRFGNLEGRETQALHPLSERVNYYIASTASDPASGRSVFALKDGSLLVSDSPNREVAFSSVVAEASRSKWLQITLASPVAMTPDGQLCAWCEEASGEDQNRQRLESPDEDLCRSVVRLTTVADQETVARLPLGRDSPLGLVVSPDGGHLLVNEGSSLRVFALPTGELRNVLEVEDADAWARLDLSGGPEHLGTKAQVQKQMETLASVAVSDDGMLVAAGGGNGRIHIWERAGGRNLAHFSSGVIGPTGLAFVPGKRRLVVAGQNAGHLQKWFRKMGEGDLNPLLMQGAMQWCPGLIQVWDLESGSLQQSIEVEGFKIYQLALSRDGRRGVSVTAQGKLDHWSLESGNVLSSIFVSRFAPVECLALVAEDRIALTAGTDGYVRAWDLETEACVGSYLANGAIHTFSASADGRSLIASDSLGWIHQLRLHGGRTWPQSELKARSEGDLLVQALSPDVSEEAAFAAVRQLGRRGVPGLPALGRILEEMHHLPYSRRDRLIRYASQGIKQSGHSQSLAALSRAIDNERDPYLQGYLLEAIAAVDSPEASRLMARLSRSPQPEMRYFVAGSLALLPEHTNRLVSDVLERILEEPDESIRSMLVVALGEAKSDEAFGALIELTRCGRPELEVEALTKMREAPTDQILGLVERLAPSATAQARIGIAELVGAVAARPDSLAGPAKALDEAFSEIVGRLDPSGVSNRRIRDFHLPASPTAGRCVAILRPMVEDSNIDVRCAVVQSLGAVVAPETRRLLLAALCDQSAAVRGAAVASLAGDASGEAEQALLSRLQDDDDLEVKQRIIRVLSLLDTPRTRQGLCDALRAPEPTIRQTAALAAGESGHLDVLFPLLRCRLDSEPIVSLAANQAIKGVFKGLAHRMTSGRVELSEFQRFAQQLRQFDRPETLEILVDLTDRLPSEAMKQALFDMLTVDLSAAERRDLSIQLDQLVSRKGSTNS